MLKILQVHTCQWYLCWESQHLGIYLSYPYPPSPNKATPKFLNQNKYLCRYIKSKKEENRLVRTQFQRNNLTSL